MRAHTLLILLGTASTTAFTSTPRRTLTTSPLLPFTASPSALPSATGVGGPGKKTQLDTNWWDEFKDRAVSSLRKDDVVIEEDYKLSWIFGMVAVIIWMIYPGEPCHGANPCFPLLLYANKKVSFTTGIHPFGHLCFRLSDPN